MTHCIAHYDDHNSSAYLQKLESAVSGYETLIGSVQEARGVRQQQEDYRTHITLTAEALSIQKGELVNLRSGRETWEEIEDLSRSNRTLIQENSKMVDPKYFLLRYE
jgi:hypothetical protein